MDWELGKATDYFDNRTMNCIWEYSQEYGKLSMIERPMVDLLIKHRIEGWLDQISSYNEALLPMVAASIVDDIYRSTNLSYYFNEDVVDYLNATAKVVMNWYSKHGFQIQYMTNNSFSDMLRPLVVFPRFFSKTGLLYLCPQYYAWEQMEKKGIPIEHFPLYYRDYVAEATNAMRELAIRCCMAGAHYVHLDVDAGPEPFDADFAYKSNLKQVQVFRKEAPQDSSKFEIL